MSEIRKGWAYVTGKGEAVLVATEQEARDGAAATDGMPALFVHADDLAAFTTS